MRFSGVTFCPPARRGRPRKITLSKAQVQDLKHIFTHEFGKRPHGAAIRAWRKLCLIAWDKRWLKRDLPTAALEVIREAKANLALRHS